MKVSMTASSKTFALLVIWAAIISSTMTGLAHDLNDVAFVGSPEWAILSPGSIKSDSLIIRRYAFTASRASYAGARKNPDARLELLDEPGTVVNAMFLNCRRKKSETDFLVLHLPEQTSLKSFPYDEWKSTIGIRTLADGKSRSVQGEYIKGDLFIDAKDMEIADFIDLMSSKELLFEFGDKADRGQLAFAEQIGTAKLQQFVRAVLPDLVKMHGAQRVQFLTSAQALAACVNFKKTGRP